MELTHRPKSIWMGRGSLGMMFFFALFAGRYLFQVTRRTKGVQVCPVGG